MVRVRFLSALFVLLLMAPAVSGLCTFYTDPKFPTLSPEVLDTKIDIQLSDGYAVVEIEKTFLNPDARTQQVGDIIFPLPSESAFITALSMTVDDVEYTAEVVERQEGRQQFSQNVDDMRDSSLLEHLGGSQYALRVILPPEEARTLKVRYEEPLVRENGQYTFRYPLTEEALSNPKSLNLRLEANTAEAFGFFDAAPKGMVIERPDARTVQLSMEAGPEDLTEDLLVTWEPIATGSTHVIVDEARQQFVLRFIPGRTTEQQAPPMPNDLLIVVDSSGSMEPHAAQVVSAVEGLLQTLTPEDHFQVAVLRNQLTPLGDLAPFTLRNAVSTLDALADQPIGGSTDLHGGLQEGIALLTEGRRGAQPVIVVVTDGVATLGLDHPTAMVHALGEANLATQSNVQIHALQVGEVHRQSEKFDPWGHRIVGADPVMELISTANFGSFAPASQLEDVLAILEGPGRVLLRDITVVAAGANGVFPEQIPVITTGGEVLITGHLQGDTANIVLLGAGAGSTKRLEFTIDRQNATIDPLAGRIAGMLRLRTLLDEIRIFGETADREGEVRTLADEFGYVTPYTSLLVELPPVPEPEASNDQVTGSGGGTTAPPPTTTSPAMTTTQPPTTTPYYTPTTTTSAADLKREALRDAEYFRGMPLVEQREYDRVVLAGTAEASELDRSNRAGGYGGNLLLRQDDEVVVLAEGVLYTQLTGKQVLPSTSTREVRGETGDGLGDQDTPMFSVPLLLAAALAAALLVRRRLA